MSTNDEKPTSEKATVTIDVEVPVESWIDWLTQSTDVFGRDYIGYWACGVQHEAALGWLIFEDEAGEFRGLDDVEPNHNEALAAWRAGEKLPTGWHKLDKEMAIKAYVIGVRTWGINWFEEKGDANTYDYVLQMAILGEERYA